MNSNKSNMYNKFIRLFSLIILTIFITGCVSKKNSTTTINNHTGVIPIDDYGSVSIDARASGSLISDISFVQVSLTGGELVHPITITLNSTTVGYTGIINDIPAGTGYSFTAEARDTDNTVIFSGSTSSISIVSGQTTHAYILMQENDPEVESFTTPVIDSLIISNTIVEPGGVVTITASASDPDGGDVYYMWGAATGTFNSTNTPSVQWTAPQSLGSVEVTLTVTNNSGNSNSITFVLTVTDEEAGSSNITVEFNTSPVITSFESNPDQLYPDHPSTTQPGVLSTDLSISAIDNEGDNISYEWTTSTNGVFTGTTANAANWTIADGLPFGMCEFRIIVTDDRGGQSIAVKRIAYTENPFVNTTPLNTAPIVNAGINQTITLPQESITLNGSASDDGLPTGTLTHNWSLDNGPASVSFNNSSLLNATVTFSIPGTYTLRLDASDTELQSSDTMIVVVNNENQGPEPDECKVVNMGFSRVTPSLRRHTFAFASQNGVPPSTRIESECLIADGLSEPVEITSQRDEYRVNEGQWTSNGVNTLINNGDSIQQRLLSPSADDGLRSSSIIFRDPDGNRYNGIFEVRTANTTATPTTYHVGPSRIYTQVNQLSDLLRAGDTVEIDGNAEYEHFAITRSGTAAQPIIIKGITINGNRPVIRGLDSLPADYDYDDMYTIHLNRSHHVRLQNLEIVSGPEVVVRIMADDIIISDCYIHNNYNNLNRNLNHPIHGILGADLGTGTVILERLEVSHLGGWPANGHLKHPVYVATDRDRYPDSKLQVISCYIHNFRGNGIKTRSRRTEIYYNWIESSLPADTPDPLPANYPDVYYTIELNGFEEYAAVPGIHCDIAGNVLIHDVNYGIRMGGDGTGALRGRVRLLNNTLIFNEDYNAYSPMLRTYQQIESVYLANNFFYKIGTGGLRFWRNEAEWIAGEIKFVGYNNWINQSYDSTNEAYWPVGMMNATVFGSTNPGFSNLSNISSINLTLDSESSLAGSGLADNSGDTGYEIDDPITVLEFYPPHQRPVSGELIIQNIRTNNGWNIGAH